MYTGWGAHPISANICCRECLELEAAEKPLMPFLEAVFFCSFLVLHPMPTALTADCLGLLFLDEPR